MMALQMKLEMPTSQWMLPLYKEQIHQRKICCHHLQRQVFPKEVPTYSLEKAM